MKKVFFIMCILFGLELQAQTVQPLYLRFDGRYINEFQWKYENAEKDNENDLPEDIYAFDYLTIKGSRLKLKTYNKQIYTEINISELNNYNIKTVYEISLLTYGKKNEVQDKFWQQYVDADNFYLVEILHSSCKARIHHVKIINADYNAKYYRVLVPIYLRFDGEKVDSKQKKYKDFALNAQNLPEDKYTFDYPLFSGMKINIRTYNKRIYKEIKIRELQNYNVITIQEINTLLSGKTKLEQENFWWQYFTTKKLYLIEILPNGKARIHHVRTFAEY